MSLEPGSTIGPFRIESLIGKGGMGEVFSATDTRLNRSVAIKILPPEFSRNSEFKGRFDREARAISSLTHPHICTLYDIGHENGTDYLVLEYIEGQTLAYRLRKGPLPLDQALEYAIQIAAALDRAHRAGIVHRDLKPGNIMLAKAGVKLLDFGLAKFLAEKPLPAVDADQPTLMERTTPGLILGTVQYMAPEQVEGEAVDHRTDIFAFGCVLYEMITGKKAFEGKSPTSVMAAILEREPQPVHSLQPLSPESLDWVLKHCLSKSPEDRWQTAYDLKLQLQRIHEGDFEPGAPKMLLARRKRREMLAWSLVVLMTVAVAFISANAARIRSTGAKITPKVIRFDLPLPADSRVGSLALSSDGQKLAIVGDSSKGSQSLWIRSLDSENLQLVSTNDRAFLPFWAPDGNAIGFFVYGALKKFDLTTGITVELCKVPYGSRGGTWNRNGQIIFSPGLRTPLQLISSTGGQPKTLTELQEYQTFGHRWPWFLPDGEHFLYWAQFDPADESKTGIFLSSLRSSSNPRFLFSATENALYASGHILFVDNRTLMAAPFDLGSKQLTSGPFPVAENIAAMGGSVTGWAMFSAADDGTLSYVQNHGVPSSQLVWYGMEGQKLGTLGKPAAIRAVDISPDGSMVCASISDDAKEAVNLWVYDVNRDSTLRLTSHSANDSAPLWSPDGKWIAFSSNLKTQYDLYVKEVGSLEPAKLLLEKGMPQHPICWSPDGKTILFKTADPLTSWDIWILPMAEEGAQPRPFLNSEHHETTAQFSPDGKWLAYVSSEQGEAEVFVISFPERRGKTKISNAGGDNPRWSKDGSRIFYQDPKDAIVEVPVNIEGSNLIAGAARKLFQVTTGKYRSFDLAPDSKRFLLIEPLDTTNSVLAKVVLNWPLEFRKR